MHVCTTGDHAAELEGGGVQHAAAGRGVGPALRTTGQSQDRATAGDRGVRGEEAGSHIHTFILVHIHTYYIHTYNTYIHTYIIYRVCTYAYIIFIYVYALCIHVCMHTSYIHAYIKNHTYIHFM